MVALFAIFGVSALGWNGVFLAESVRSCPIDKASRDVAAYCRQPFVADTTQPTTNPGGKPFSFKAINP